ncbi:MAG TPA: endonuclease/exonuclease/phosphatase family protein [Polyangiaceae bacterium]|nr:endonuclease/exonuclease/phosphatase family protein [Polyangiaceae bacterium]
MRIVTWNMNHWKRSREARAKAWEYLRRELGADVALVQEAVPPPESAQVYKPIDPPRSDWGSAVVALSPAVRLNPTHRRPLASPSSEGGLAESHPGVLAVADVIDTASGKTRFVAASFYGAWEYLPQDPINPKKKQEIYSTSKSHRVLSDLTPLLVWTKNKPHKIPVLLAGDFNATTQIAAENSWDVEIEEAKALFQRIHALGLYDLTARTRDARPRLVDCSCPAPDTCSHVRTYRNGNRPASRPTQLDYVFASDGLASQVSACTVRDEDAAWALSDHCPVVVDLPDA